jgi:hypothetical protein
MVQYAPRAAPPEAYKTFGIANPGATHWRPATCREVDCANLVNGFKVTCDLRTPLGLKQARYVRDTAAERHQPYAHAWLEGDKIIVFIFEAGQECFYAHRLPLGRPALFLVRNGDHRGSGRRSADRRIYDRSDQWQDDFATHQDRLAEAARRG